MTDNIKPVLTDGKIEATDLCADHDEDCVDVKCKTTCWLYQPERGYCPYLKDHGEPTEPVQLTRKG